jgi:hypothetical protein
LLEASEECTLRLKELVLYFVDQVVLLQKVEEDQVAADVDSTVLALVSQVPNRTRVIGEDMYSHFYDPLHRCGVYELILLRSELLQIIRILQLKIAAGRAKRLTIIACRQVLSESSRIDLLIFCN